MYIGLHWVFLLSRTFLLMDTLMDKNWKTVICSHLSIYFQSFTGSSFIEAIPFLQPLFSRLTNYISHFYQSKRPDCVKGRQIKRRDGGRKGQPGEPGDGGKQGFQINYWSGVRWTFNLTNQLPNYTSAARMVYPMHLCVCSWLALRVEVLL